MNLFNSSKSKGLFPCTASSLNVSVTEYSELKSTHNDHPIQLLSEQAVQDSNPQRWCYQHNALTKWANLESNGFTSFVFH